jgi:hypothetical protein
MGASILFSDTTGTGTLPVQLLHDYFLKICNNSTSRMSNNYGPRKTGYSRQNRCDG